MVWEQGSVVIVMLTKLTENGSAMCHRYWPEEGSDLYHIYEVSAVLHVSRVACHFPQKQTWLLGVHIADGVDDFLSCNVDILNIYFCMIHLFSSCFLSSCFLSSRFLFSFCFFLFISPFIVYPISCLFPHY